VDTAIPRFPFELGDGLGQDVDLHHGIRLEMLPHFILKAILMEDMLTRVEIELTYQDRLATEIAELIGRDEAETIP